MVQKKVRMRKALTIREQAELTRAKDEASREPSETKLSAVKNKLPGASIGRLLRTLLRPLRWLVPTYFVNAWREVRQVTWPNRRETWRLTLAVFIFAIVFGSLVAGVDKGIDEIFKKVILKK